MTLEEKAQILSNIFSVTEVVPKGLKDQITGIIIGYSMAHQMKEDKKGA